MKEILQNIKKLNDNYNQTNFDYFENIIKYIIEKGYEIKVLKINLNQVFNIPEIILPIEEINKFIDVNKENIFICNHQSFFKLFILHENYYISFCYFDEEENRKNIFYKKTKADLKNLCKEKGINFNSKMTKEDLLNLLKNDE